MGMLGSGPKTTTTEDTKSQSQQQQNVTGSLTGQQNVNGTQQAVGNTNSVQTSSPNAPDWYKSFLSSIPSQYQALAGTFKQGAQQNLYGPQQQAQYQQGLAQQTGASRQALNSQLASMGALNSSRTAQANTQLSLGQNNQLGNYLAQVPQMNAAYKTQQQNGLQGVLQGMGGFTSPLAAYGQTVTGNNNTNQFANSNQNANTTQQTLQNILSQIQGEQNSVGTQQTKSNVLGSLLNGVLGAGASFLTGGLSNLAGGGSFLGGGK